MRGYAGVLATSVTYRPSPYRLPGPALNGAACGAGRLVCAGVLPDGAALRPRATCNDLVPALILTAGCGTMWAAALRPRETRQSYPAPDSRASWISSLWIT